MKLKDITTGTNPVSGQKINILDPTAWIGLIIGAGVLALAWAYGKKAADKVETRVSGNDGASVWDNVFNKT